MNLTDIRIIFLNAINHDPGKQKISGFGTKLSCACFTGLVLIAPVSNLLPPSTYNTQQFGGYEVLIIIIRPTIMITTSLITKLVGWLVIELWIAGSLQSVKRVECSL